MVLRSAAVKSASVSSGLKASWARSSPDGSADRGGSACDDPPTLSVAGKIWIRVFPDKPITNKPLEVRMGKGKGNVEYWVAPDPAW